MTIAKARVAFTLVSAVALVGSALASGESGSYADPAGDASLRRTDPGNDGVINPMAVLPDVVSVVATGWQPTSPATDPYTGVVVPSDGASVFRMDVVFEGLLNPPGPLGLGASPFEPFRYGPSPVYGFVECNLDGRMDTGGELGSAATLRYYANLGRFGEVPEGSRSDLVAHSGTQLDLNFFTAPFYERSGQDYSLNLCGCYDVTVVNTFGDFDGTFDAGDTWVVRGRFWQRAGGYEEASAAFGGSFFGLYDPFVNLRFSHDAMTDRTTVTLVEALTMPGAAALRGQPVQPIDLSVFNHTSVEEAISDIKFGAGDPFLSPEARILVEEWENRPVEDALEPDRWEISAIFGVTYLNVEQTLYAWTDALGDHYYADLNADAVTTQLDVDAFDTQLALLDGTAQDADGTVDGDVEVVNFGPNFQLIDFNSDGFVDGGDRMLILGVEPGDCDGSGTIDFSDLVCILFQFGPGTGPADCDGSGTINFNDLVCTLFVFD